MRLLGSRGRQVVQLHAVTWGRHRTRSSPRFAGAVALTIACVGAVGFANAGSGANEPRTPVRYQSFGEAENAGAAPAPPSRVTFLRPAWRDLRTVVGGPSSARPDAVDPAAPRLLELKRLAARGLRPLNRRWSPYRSPFDVLTVPSPRAAIRLPAWVAEPERWGPALEASQLGEACPCITGYSPGRVPDGAGLPGSPLWIERALSVPTDIVLDWSASCSRESVDYAVYEGLMGSWYARSARLCSTGGALSATLAPQAGNRYYLVVPLDSDAEGSYGVDSNGAERPPAGTPCRAFFVPDSCP